MMLGGSDEFKSVMKEFQGNSKALDIQFGKMEQSSWFQQQKAIESIKNMSIELGTSLLPVVVDLSKQIVPLLKRFSEWIRNNKEFIKSITKTALVVGSIILTLGVLVTTIGWVVKAVGGYKIAMEALAKYTAFASTQTGFLSGTVQKFGRMSKLQGGIMAAGAVSWMIVLSELMDKTTQAGSDFRVATDSMEGFRLQLKKLMGFFMYLFSTVLPGVDSTQAAQIWGGEAVSQIDDYAKNQKIGMYENWKGGLVGLKKEMEDIRLGKKAGFYEVPEIEKKKQSMDFTFSQDSIAGTIKIEVDSKGNAEVKEARSENKNLGFQVGRARY